VGNGGIGWVDASKIARSRPAIPEDRGFRKRGFTAFSKTTIVLDWITRKMLRKPLLRRGPTSMPGVPAASMDALSRCIRSS
jgi:hypothetical protein